MTKLISYKGNEELKDLLVMEIIRHRKDDAIIQGTYGEENGKWKGCAVGCSIHSLNIKLGKDFDTSNHKIYETELGIPEWLARLEDTIFEGLTVEESKTWPEQFAQAIPVGVDLDPVKWKFCAFILKENIERVLTLKISDDLKKQVVDAIRGVLNVHEKAVETGVWDETAAESAESAAWSAWSARSAESAAWSAARSARSATWSAAWSAAESAAESARSAESAAWSAAESAAESARSAESAAWSAARSARSATWSAAWSAAYKNYATELLRLLAKAK